MERDSKMGVAIITGAASGIGYATARALASAGYAVAIVDVSGSAAESAAGEIVRETGGVAQSWAADVTDAEATSTAFQGVCETLGPPTVLVNNAGIVVRKKARLEDLPQSDIDEMMAIHVGGTLGWSRLVIPGMRKAGHGRIINISSVNAITAVPYRIGYVTAKKAIRGLTEALAVETARAGITVNAIAPGYILTDVLKARAEAGILDRAAIADRTPVGRWGAPEDIANAAVFLASRDAGYITGTTLVVDGGYSIRGDAGEDLDLAPEERPTRLTI